MKNKQIIMGLCGLLLVGGTNLITSCTNKTQQAILHLH